MVPKKGHLMAFLGYPLWPNIVTALDGQAGNKEHGDFLNLVTLQMGKVSSLAI